LRVGCSRASAAAEQQHARGPTPNAPTARVAQLVERLRARRRAVERTVVLDHKVLFARLRSGHLRPRSSGRPRRSRVRAWCGAACAAAPGSRPPGPRYRTGSVERLEQQRDVVDDEQVAPSCARANLVAPATHGGMDDWLSACASGRHHLPRSAASRGSRLTPGRPRRTRPAMAASTSPPAPGLRGRGRPRR